MAHRNINAAGLALIKSFETFVGYVYDDLRVGKGGRYPEWTGWKPVGTLTIGYGHTDDAKHPLKIRKGLRISEEEASRILDVDLDECEDRVSRAVKVQLSDNQFAALVSFDFNTGAIFKASFVKALNRGDYAAVRPGLMQYVKAKGQTLRGLVRRREAEAALFTRKDAPRAKVDPIQQIDKEPAGNVVPEPPVVDEPLSKSGVVQGASVAGLTGGAKAIDDAKDMIVQAQDGADHISAGTVLGCVLGLIIFAGAAYAIFSRVKAAGKLPGWWPAWAGGEA